VELSNPVCFSAQYIYVRSRQLEGTYPGDKRTGTWPITANRIGRGWGYVREEHWPYDTSVWPPIEPPGLDNIAIKKPDFYYQRARTPEDCKSALALQRPVMVALSISDKWYDAPRGKIPEAAPSDVYIGNHTVLLYDYDDSAQELSFQNSWGVNWGDKGHGYIPYTVFEETWVEGWFHDLAAKPMADNPASGVQERRWGVLEHGGGILHCYEFVHSKAGRIGWSFLVERQRGIEVEELFIMPAFRRMGYAARLVELIREYVYDRSASLTFWISHADTAPENLVAIEKLASKLGLRLSTSPVKWASYVCQ
jgi:GNAT superfamily N-acetyltransferase